MRRMVLNEENGAEPDVKLASVQFADDCTNVVLARDEWMMQRVMTICSKLYHEYFSAQGMKLNLTKEEHIIHSPSSAMRMKPDGVMVDGRPEAKNVKLLGIVVDRDYKFTTHVSKVVAKTSYKLAHVARVKDLLTDKQLRMVTDSLVFSTLYWGLDLVGRDLQNLRRLQKMQNCVLRMLTRSDMKMSVRLMLEKVSMLNMQNQCRMMQMSLIRRTIRNGGCPVTMSYVIMPGDRSRDGFIRNTFPNKRKKHGDRAILPKALTLLNGMKWMKEKGRDTKAWYVKSAKRYLLATFPNTNKLKA